MLLHRAVAGFLIAAAIPRYAPPTRGEHVEVRLRFVWGSRSPAPQKWFGRISATEAEFIDLQPLGVEADEAAALRILENGVTVAPISARSFDGCDVTLRGDETALINVALRHGAAAQGHDVQLSLGALIAKQARAPLDDVGGYLLVERAPGDALRVRMDREHLVLAPAETLRLGIETDRSTDVAVAPVAVEARLRRVGDAEALWKKDLPLDPTSTAGAVLSFETPLVEGAYCITLTARQPSSLTGKLVPWDQSDAPATRDVEFVVIDPGAHVPRLTDRWEEVQSIDPANSRWLRLPEWTQIEKLPGLAAPRVLGNVKPTITTTALGPIVQLPAIGASLEPAWQAYVLSTRAIGELHCVEISIPAGGRERLAVSIIEPDASGRAASFGREAGVFQETELGSDVEATAGVHRHRVLFWPRTTSPILLIANHSRDQAAKYGTIRIRRRVVEPVPPGEGMTAMPTPDTRLAAAYISNPRWPECLGASEVLDSTGNLSVDSWSTFLDASRRLAQLLRAGGYNAACVCVAADGASLSPLPGLGISPRYDTGLLSSRAPDPTRKDVLEALLRVFDREGLLLLPVIELAAPLPALEQLRGALGSDPVGIECVARDGRTWSTHYPDLAEGARYNILDPRVQSVLARTIDEFIERYRRHPAFAGVGLRLTGRGYGVLPGLAWGFDENTTSRFAKAMKVTFDPSEPDPVSRRAAMLLGPELPRWSAWRQAQVADFYGGLAEQIRRERQDLRLMLFTEDLFTGPEASRRMRQAVSGRASIEDAAAELGADFTQLSSRPGICVLRPRRLASHDDLEARAVDLLLNGSTEIDQAFATSPRTGELMYHVARPLRLPSFDGQSPYGPGKTQFAANVPAYCAGAGSLRPLATALASRDFCVLIDGGEALPLADDSEGARARRIFQRLPVGAEVRTERRQPATLRVYRTDLTTSLCLINESAWPIDVEVPLECTEPTTWRDLDAAPTIGAEAASDNAAEPTGVSPVGAQAWRVRLPPHGIVARRFETRSLRVGAPTTQTADHARAALQMRIAEIEQRLPNLDVQRPYVQLENPSFELTGDDGAIVGWQPRVGQAGRVAIDEATAHSGVRTLHLQSEDNVGVAVQSHMFAVPDTGQILVRAQARTSNLAPEASLYALAEYDVDGSAKRRCVELDVKPSASGWVQCEFGIDDLPLAAKGQMRVLFFLQGRGDAWIDSVELYDLSFSHAQRVDLIKRLLIAKTALRDEQVVDCQRLVDGYWQRYLIERLPPTPSAPLEPAAEVNVASRPQETSPAPDDQPKSESGLRGRVRRLVPRILR